jgi:hypothetical protein
MRGVQSRSLFGSSQIRFWFTKNLTHFSQLEAIIRISESMAKLTLSPVVQNHHVDEAIRLFKFSTMDAVSAGSADGLSRGELNEEMVRIEKEIRRRLPVGWSTSYQSLVKEFVTQQGYSSHALERTLFMMEKREIVRFSNQVCPWSFFECTILTKGDRKKLFIGLVYDALFDYPLSLCDCRYHLTCTLTDMNNVFGDLLLFYPSTTD